MMPPLGPALLAATGYFLALFTLGFVLGTARVLLIAPRIGALAATLAEVPVMLAAAYYLWCAVLRRWHLSTAPAVRWTMAVWFLVLLAAFETALGMLLFGRSPAAQWAGLATPAGLLGLSAQLVAALFPVFLGAPRDPRGLPP